MFTWKDVLDNVQRYTNSPKLTKELTQADVDAILSTAIDFDYGSCSVCLIGVDYVFYFTQCPAKYFHSQLCQSYKDCALQITPVGIYEDINVYIAPKVNIIDDKNFSLQGEIGEENRQFILRWKNVNDHHTNIDTFTDEVISMLDVLSPNKTRISRDYEFFNFAWQDGQLLAVDTVFYKEL